MSDTAGDSGRHAALLECLEKLPAKERALVEDCYRAGATIRQVAERLGRPANVIYKRLRHVREQLRDCVDQTIAVEGRE